MKPTYTTRGIGTLLAHVAFLCPALSIVVPVAWAQSTTSVQQETNTTNSTSDPAVTDDKRKSEKVITMDKIEVTGSRVRRLDVQTVSPIVAITKSEMDSRGFSTIEDMLRSLPFNSGQALSQEGAGTSFTPGIETVNLRGLGNNNTLALINGRRAAPYASPGFNGFQTMFDVRSIPDAALESVEILKDGGSAIYGSDAVAGVINYKLKKNYTGVTISYQLGDYVDTSGFNQKVSFVAGAKAGRTSIVFAGNWMEEAAVYARDLSYSRNADKRGDASSADPYYSVSTGSEAGLAKVQAKYGPAANAGAFDNRSTMGYPGSAVIDKVSYTIGTATNTPTLADVTGGANRFNFQDESGLFSETRRYSVYASVHHDFNNYLYGFVEASFARNEAQSASASPPINLTNENGTNAAGTMEVPVTNPYNPWGNSRTDGGQPVPIAAGTRRLIETGPRYNDITSDTPRLLAGLGGKLDFLADWLTGWNWEVGALYTKSTVSNTNPGSVTDYRMQQALNGLTRMGDGSLDWDPSTAEADRVYFNWFGLNEEAFAKFLRTNNPTSASMEYENYDFRVDGPLFSLPGGEVSLAIGAEHRSEDFANIKTDLNATSNIIGGSSGTSSFGNRKVDSIYAELVMPVFKWLELQAAGRYEMYSDDGFDEKVRPKAGIKLRPFDWLVLRGSYSQSFKAPDLAYLYTGAQMTFSNQTLVDPVTNSTISSVPALVTGNRNLKPETTDAYYAGFAIEPARGPLKGLHFGVDYFIFDQKDLLAQLSDFYSWEDFLQRAADGDPVFSQLVVRDPASQTLLYVMDVYSNISTARYEGFDFDLSYTWTMNTLGTFRVGIGGTYIGEFLIDEDDVSGSKAIPPFRGNAQLGWRKQDWTANLFLNYITNRRTALMLEKDRDPDIGTALLHYNVKEQYVVNANISYSGLWDTKITVGVDNLFNTEPPLDPRDPNGYVTGVNYGKPMFWYLRMERSF